MKEAGWSSTCPPMKVFSTFAMPRAIDTLSCVQNLCSLTFLSRIGCDPMVMHQFILHKCFPFCVPKSRRVQRKRDYFLPTHGHIEVKRCRDRTLQKRRSIETRPTRRPFLRTYAVREAKAQTNGVGSRGAASHLCSCSCVGFLIVACH